MPRNLFNEGNQIQFYTVFVITFVSLFITVPVPLRQKVMVPTVPKLLKLKKIKLIKIREQTVGSSLENKHPGALVKGQHLPLHLLQHRQVI